MNVPYVFLARRRATDAALARLHAELPRLDAAARHPGLTIYATGSLGRGEVGKHSDLDVFLVDTRAEGEPGHVGNLARIRLLSQLMDVAEAAGFPAFSGDGEFLAVHPLADLRDLLGTRDDDARNVFTARMLLLLESVPLVGRGAYDTSVDDVLDAYWRDCWKPEGFLPYVLLNDLVRYWKTLCVNYEGYRRDDRTQRRVALVKLRFNRLWTCFAALAYLAAGYREVEPGLAHITREHATAMVGLTPLERLVRVVELRPAAAPYAQIVVDEMGWWLAASDVPKEELRARFADRDVYREARRHGDVFGDAMGDLLDAVVAGTSLRRKLLV
jgi:hypothetical protein